jgi:sterol desaturase/sphingolipid hydroxylase (fatty acid hydroxylase superfamily)
MFTDISINTPALLFPTVSLLYIGYTNRFMSIASLVRGLKEKFLATHDEDLLKQIANLRRRIVLIRNMQLMGIAALIVNVFSIVALYLRYQNTGEMLFFVSLILLILSMIAAIREVFISVDALNIELSSVEELKEELAEKGILKRIFNQDN